MGFSKVVGTYSSYTVHYVRGKHKVSASRARVYPFPEIEPMPTACAYLYGTNYHGMCNHWPGAA